MKDDRILVMDQDLVEKLVEGISTIGESLERLANKEQHAGPLLLKVDEAARLLGVTQSKILKLVDAGVLPAVKMGPGSRSGVRIPVESLHDWISSHIRRKGSP